MLLRDACTRALILFIVLLVPGVILANPWGIISSAEAENCGRFTIAPGGGENLVDPDYGNDYQIHITILDCNGDPVVGLAATDLWLWHNDLATCPYPFSQADGPTDENGHTTFSGKIFAGLWGDSNEGIDCDEAFLYVFALGIILNDGNSVCVSTDSPDLDGDLQVSIPDFARFVQDFNCVPLGIPCDSCHDYDEDGETGLTDLALFSGYFNASTCP